MQLGQHLVGRKVKFTKFGDKEWTIMKVVDDKFILEYHGKEYPYEWLDNSHELVPMKIYEEFERAKELMQKDSDYLFICWALCAVNTGASFNQSDANDAANKWFDYRKSPSAAGKIINQRLGGYASIENWVEDKIGTANFLTYSRADRAIKLRATRLAWLDSLVAEFKTKNE